MVADPGMNATDVIVVVVVVDCEHEDLSNFH